MPRTISFELTDEMDAALARAATKEGVSIEDLLRKILSHDLLMRDLAAVREELIPYARRKGIQTEEDVFRIVS